MQGANGHTVLCAGAHSIQCVDPPLQRGASRVESGRPHHVWFIVALVVLAAPCLLLHLGTLPIRLWDESRQAVSALEMMEGGNPLVPTYLGKPDMWNTKPPLLIWLQVASLRAFGFSEVAIRLPSALAALATVGIVFWFCAKALGNPRIGLFAGLVLVSSRGYVGPHVARTGDYDALLTLWTTASALSFFLFLETSVDGRKPWYLGGTAGYMALAVLTKATSGLLVLPGVAIYALLRGRARSLFRCRGLLPSLALFLAVVGGYYGLREHRNPGYFAAVLKNDVGGRFFSTIEQHEGPFDYYYTRLRDTRFSPWLYYLPFGLAVGLVSRRERVRDLALFLTFGVLVFMAVISAGETKLEWYDAPFYPLAALLVAIGLDSIMESLVQTRIGTGPRHIQRAALVILLGFAMFGQPYRAVFNAAWSPREERWEQEKYQLAYFLRSECLRGPSFNAITIAYQGFDQHLRVYAAALRSRGCAVSFAPLEQLAESTLVAASQEPVKAQIESLYVHEVVRDMGDARVYLIQSRTTSHQSESGPARAIAGVATCT